MDMIEIVLNNSELQWFKNKGYDIPVERVQLWVNKPDGTRIKNGIDYRIKAGTKLFVRVDDLPPSSNRQVEWTCECCGIEQSTTYYAFLRKKSRLCRVCFNTTQRNLDSHEYWVQQLIEKNPEAKCAISGESDKRFLVLHHLTSRSKGGKNCKENYVILTANWHLAFHRWMGGTNKPCTPEHFVAFTQEINNET